MSQRNVKGTRDLLPPETAVWQGVERVVREVIAEVGAESPRDMGRVMKPVLERLGGAADGKQVSEIVRRLLAPAAEG